jgi:hypothetical protein
MIIELKGYVAEDGKITLDDMPILPPGSVHVLITYPDPDEAEDEALWDVQFAATPPAAFDLLIQDSMADYERGETEAFDPNQEDD